jgi:hypothetical protein
MLDSPSACTPAWFVSADGNVNAFTSLRIDPIVFRAVRYVLRAVT